MSCKKPQSPIKTTCNHSSGPISLCGASYNNPPHNMPSPAICEPYFDACTDKWPCWFLDYIGPGESTNSWTLSLTLGNFTVCTYACTTTYKHAEFECKLVPPPPPPECATTTTTTTSTPPPGNCEGGGG